MKLPLGLAAGLLAVTPFLSASGQAATSNNNKGSTGDKHYIVLFKNQSVHSGGAPASIARTPYQSVFQDKQFVANKAQSLVVNLGGKVSHTLSSVKGVAASLTAEQLKVLKNNPQVALVEEDPLRTFQAEVTPYGITKVQADQVSDANSGSIKVCIPDTGIDINHEDLPSNANITGEVSNTLTVAMDIGQWYEDSYGHGTHMAGTIAAIGGNGIGTVGVNPSGNINLHIVKIVDNPNWWPFRGSDMIAAVERCQAAGANIINLSIAGNKSSVAEEQAMQAAYDSGILIFGASGKGGSAAYSYPASYDSVVSVAAVDSDENAWIYSHYNDQIEVSTPGVNIKSTTPGNSYSNWDGTSVATAYASGVAGLVWSNHPECTASEIRNILDLSAKDLGDAGRDIHYGYGLLQAKDAVDLIDQAGCDGIPNSSPTISGNPAISVNENRDYSFTPTAEDPDGDPLTFSVSGLPPWASFDSSTGTVSGNPGGIGSANYPNITITVSDTEFSADLTFAIAVVPSVYSEWSNTGEPQAVSDWTPAIVAQTVSFEQNRPVKQGQSRTEQQQALDPNTLQPVDIGSPITHTREIDDTQTRTVTVAVDAWAEQGAAYQCDTWSPATDTVDFGTVFTQTRNCQQDRLRTWSYSATGMTTITRQESDTITVEQSQSASGSKRNWVATTPSYTAWVDDGVAYNYSTWSPAASTQTADFSQSRSYSQNQTRTKQTREKDTITGDIRDVGTATTESQTITGSESRTVSVYKLSWVNENSPYDCTAWSPAVDTIDYGTAFTQTRSCSQDQTRSWSYQVGSTVLNTRVESQTISVSQSQSATGTKRNWVSTTPTYTTWTNDGARYNYSTWSPAASTQTANFSQSRSYSQNQTRTKQAREQDTITGDIRNVGSPTIETQTISGSESRTVAVSAGSWANQGAVYQCSDWSPLPGTVDYGTVYTQTRSCQQDRQRTWSYVAGGSSIYTRVESGSTSVNQSQSATGTKRNWVSTTPTYTAWTNDGARYNYSAWSPAASTQTANFSQSRSYSQNQTRTKQAREQDTITGDIRNVGSPTIETQTISGSESRTVAVSVGSWANQGAVYQCSDWSPLPGTVDYGTVFTQTRSCQQDRQRTWSYVAGGSSIYTRVESGSTSVNQSQSATGTKRNWVSITPTYTTWTNDGARYNYSAWSPAASTQTANFSQSRSYSQNQTRTKQAREQDTITGDIRNVGSPTTETQTISGSESRTVAVSQSGWANDKSPSCTAWSPAASTFEYGVTFQQTRSCSQDQVRSWSYQVGSTVIYSRNESQTVTSSESQSATGTMLIWQPYGSSYTSWTDTGSGYSYGAWSPTAGSQTNDFTQSRSYSQDQYRYEQKREQEIHTGEIRNVGSPLYRTRTVSRSQSRSVTISYTSWTNNGGHYDCGNWSPAASTIDEGKVFTQYRDCSQDQVRYREYYVSSTSIARVLETHTVNQTEAKTPVIGTCPNSYSAWIDGSTSNYTSWSPAPVLQTSNYTQTRNYDQSQSRTVTACSGTKTSESRVVTKSQSRTVIVTKISSSGSLYNCSSWSPTASTQTGSFTQSRSCSVDVTETWSHTVGSTTIHGWTKTKTNSVTDSRSVSVSYSAWSNSGSAYNCTAWDPLAWEYPRGEPFTQTRQCTQDQTRNRLYSAGGSTIASFSESQTITVSQSQITMGTGPACLTSLLCNIP